MTNDVDTITLYDEDGKELTLEILEYFLLNGQEYVILTEILDEDTESIDKMDVFIMQVNILDDENEEFVNVDSEKEEEVYSFAEKLISGEIENPDEFY